MNEQTPAPRPTEGGSYTFNAKTGALVADATPNTAPAPTEQAPEPESADSGAHAPFSDDPEHTPE